MEVAAGFQKDVLADDELIMPEHFARYLGFVETPAEAYVHNISQKLNLTFDWSTSVPDEVFDKSHNGSRGKFFLQKYSLPSNMTVKNLTDIFP